MGSMEIVSGKPQARRLLRRAVTQVAAGCLTLCAVCGGALLTPAPAPAHPIVQHFTITR